ncbi:unnamed protein product [Symbiodinium natans]|uniref:Uncharacterized protein n=1 Tax=Symbiodinium natans TaxID=878477 RepID=A0A812LPA5_9DINO|nr:unnamed protein product [Symbiodinium natans]
MPSQVQRPWKNKAGRPSGSGTTSWARREKRAWKALEKAETDWKKLQDAKERAFGKRQRKWQGEEEIQESWWSPEPKESWEPTREADGPCSSRERWSWWQVEGAPASTGDSTSLGRCKEPEDDEEDEEEEDFALHEWDPEEVDDEEKQDAEIKPLAPWRPWKRSWS